MILMIDNYDSFTYNLVQYFMQLGEEVAVYRNDAISIAQAEQLEFDYLVISPGPGNPSGAGCSKEMIRHFAGKKPVLGVCLGHQSIGEVFGATIVQAKRIMHGKSDMVSHDGKSLFSGMPNPLRVIRYHSLAIDKKTLPEELEVTATSSDGEIMAIRHKSMRVEGVQFHPESIGTEEGIRLLSNFLKGIRELPPVKTLLRKVVNREHLSQTEAGHMMEQITEGVVSPSQIGAFLTALTMKQVTADELTGFVTVLRKKTIPFPVDPSLVLTDTCGTGGDSSHTFNISTAATFISCGAGVRIAKHGNRSVTSHSGSADVLESLGVAINLAPAQAVIQLEQQGFCFMFAPAYHPAFKNIMLPRKELAFRTVFNMMGPLLNPARAQRQVMGVFSADIADLIATVLNNLGCHHALVVHGNDGLDEITLTTTTRITEVKNGWIRTWTLDPVDFGFDYCHSEDLKGGDSTENSEITLRILKGEKGPKRDIVVLNSAAAIYVSGVAPDFRTAIVAAKESLDTGKALRCLEQVVAFTASSTVESFRK